MNCWILLLRGINVSGQKSIKMTFLKNAFTERGYRNVRTYIQSGNIILQAEIANRADIEEASATLILQKTGFHVPVIAITPEELSGIVKEYPCNSEGVAAEKSYITFLDRQPDRAAITLLERFRSESERIEFSGRQVYLYFENGYGKSRLNNNFIESKLKVVATTRNLKTLNKLLLIAKE